MSIPITTAPPIITLSATTSEHKHKLTRNASILIFGAVVSYLVYLSMNNLSPAEEVLLTEGTSNAIAAEKAQEETDLSIASIDVDDKSLVDNNKDFTLVFANDFTSLQMPDIDISLLNKNTFPVVEDIKFERITTPIVIKPEEAVEIEEVAPVTTIEPFGGLSWDNNLFEVIQKIQKFESLESITLKLGSRTYNIKTDNGLTLAQLQKIIAISPKKTLLRPYSFSSSEFARRKVLGINKVVLISHTTITAKPIILANGSFELEVVFQSEPGYILKNFDNALTQAKQVSGNNADFYFPLQLHVINLTLKSITTTLEPTREDGQALADNIRNLLKTKYHSSLLHQSSSNRLLWRDNTTHELTLKGEYSRYSNGVPKIKICYSNTDIHHQEELAAFQKRITEEAHKKRFADKKDSRKAL